MGAGVLFTVVLVVVEFVFVEFVFVKSPVRASACTVACVAGVAAIACAICAARARFAAVFSLLAWCIKFGVKSNQSCDCELTCVRQDFFSNLARARTVLWQQSPLQLLIFSSDSVHDISPSSSCHWRNFLTVHFSHLIA